MDRYRGFWWSPNSKMIVFEEVDEKHVPIFTISHQGLDEIIKEEHRYIENVICNHLFINIL